METTKVQTKKKQQNQAASYLRPSPEGAKYFNLCKKQEKCKKNECKAYHPLWAQNCCVPFMYENCFKEKCQFNHKKWVELIQKSKKNPEMRVDEYTLKPFEGKRQKKDAKSSKITQSQQEEQKCKQNIQSQHQQSVNATNFQIPSTTSTKIDENTAQPVSQDYLQTLCNNNMAYSDTQTLAQNITNNQSNNLIQSQENNTEGLSQLDLKVFKFLLIYKDEIMIDQGKLGQWFREVNQKYEDKTQGILEQYSIDKTMQHLEKSNEKQESQVQEKEPKSKINKNKKDKTFATKVPKQILSSTDNQSSDQEINQEIQFCSEKQAKLYAKFKGYNEALLESQYISGNQLTKHELCILRKLVKKCKFVKQNCFENLINYIEKYSNQLEDCIQLGICQICEKEQEYSQKHNKYYGIIEDKVICKDCRKKYFSPIQDLSIELGDKQCFFGLTKAKLNKEHGTYLKVTKLRAYLQYTTYENLKQWLEIMDEKLSDIKVQCNACSKEIKATSRTEFTKNKEKYYVCNLDCKLNLNSRLKKLEKNEKTKKRVEANLYSNNKENEDKYELENQIYQNLRMLQKCIWKKTLVIFRLRGPYRIQQNCQVQRFLNNLQSIQVQ
eukprot:403360271